MKEKPVSKRIWIEQGQLRYEISDGIGWNTTIADVQIVGEYTDPNGPYVDDYFFVFITKPSHYWNEASFYANGRDEVLTQLGNKLGGELVCGLTHSTDYASRVLWPRQLQGAELFEFVPVEAKGLWQKLWFKLVPQYYFKFTEVVRDYLKDIN